MKTYQKLSIVAIMLHLFSVAACALDLDLMDRISVSMPKSQVRAILGEPARVVDMAGLKVELYLPAKPSSVASVGYFYEKDQILAGYSFVFNGHVASQSAARLASHGFKVLEQVGEYSRLSGLDDDTGRPIVVTISQNDELTTVTTFEKGFYERRSN